MQFTKEQIAKAAEAKSAEELAELAKENNVWLSPKQAEHFFAELHREGELTDDELDAVAGGKGDPPEPNQDGYDVVNISDADPRCPVCGNQLHYDSYWCEETTDHGAKFDRFYCGVCPLIRGVYRRYWTGCVWTKDFRD